MRIHIKPGTRPDLALLGAEIRRLREKAGLTQEELGEKVGRKQSFIGKIERAEQLLSVPMMFDLFKALNVEPADVMRSVSEELKRYEKGTT